MYDEWEGDFVTGEKLNKFNTHKKIPSQTNL